jgi:tetratricopeptide (TPR) repeat protein
MYHSRLLGTRTLVLLDNAASEDQVRDLLPTAPGCAGLVTSRRAGDVNAGEGIRLDPLTTDEAITLFRHLVGRVRLRHDMAAVAQVVEHCARLPLQIKVVASLFRRHPGWPTEHLLELLADAGAWREGSELAKEPLAAWAVSYQQLSDSEQALFRLFGQLPGPDASVAAAAALAHRTVSSARVLLEELHGVSLLEEHVPDRYLILDPLKDYASAGLEPASPSEVVEATDRWLDHYLVAASAAMRVAFPVVQDELPELHRASPVVVEFPDGQAAREWLTVERANLLAAVRFAAAHDRPEHTWQLAVVLWRWYAAQGMVPDWVETLELALRTLDVTHTDRGGLAYVLLRLAGARWQSGEPGQAQQLAERALSLWTETEDVRGQAWALTMVAMLDMELTDNKAATAHFEAALAHYEQVGDKRGRANTLSNLGRLNELSGRLDVADDQHSTAITLLEEIGHSQGLAHALDNRGVTRQRLDRLEDAMADYGRACVLAHEVGDRRGEAYTVNNIANVHRLLGQFDDALREHAAARELADTVTDPTLRSQLYIDRGATFYAKGDYSQALNAYFAALDLIGGGHVERDKRPDAEHGAARTLHQLGRHAEAAEHWQAAVDTYVELERPEFAEVQGELGRLSCLCVGDSESTG